MLNKNGGKGDSAHMLKNTPFFQKISLRSPTPALFNTAKSFSQPLMKYPG
jgi:hypothetical protein